MLGKSQIRLLTIGAVLVTALAIGLISLTGFRALIEVQHRAGLERLVLSESERVALALREVRSDVQLLARLPSVAAVVGRDPGDSGGDAEREQVEQVLFEMLRAKEYYAQIRLIGADDGGRELVRVERRRGAVRRVPREGLQQKGDRKYYQEAIATPPAEVYYSQVNLNRERGRIETPHLPVLRMAVRVDDPDGAPRGFVIINLDFDTFLSETLRLDTASHVVYLTNDLGDYLLHPDRSKAYGFDLGRRFLVQEEFPAVSPLLTGGQEEASTRLPGGPGAPGGGELHFARVSFFPGARESFFLLGVGVSYEEFVAGSRGVLRRAGLATFALAMGALLVGYGVSRLQTEPLEKIAAAAAALSRGEPMPALPVERPDEVGDLSRAFVVMAAELQKHEADLQAVNKRLALANEDLDHFVHVAAHDLREPLRKQRNLIDLLVEETEPGLTTESRELLRSVFDCAQVMQGMVDDFRALTRIGQENISREPADPGDLIDQALETHKEEIDRRGVRVKIDPHPNRVQAYPTYLVLLYSNLVANALKHVPADGFTLRFSAVEQRGEWVFGVENTGSSVPAESRREVFKMFRKGGGGSRGESTGVGLSICKRVVDRHRGDIWVDPGEGSAHFRFTLNTKGGSDGREAAER